MVRILYRIWRSPSNLHQRQVLAAASRQFSRSCLITSSTVVLPAAYAGAPLDCILEVRGNAASETPVAPPWGLEAVMSAALTTRIPIKDRNGNVVSEKEVATYAGLLTCAHDEGLKGIRTEVLQIPHGDNGEVAIVKATVETERGVFEGIGDAGPESVGRRILPHIIRMAETRAKARALRDAVNIGLVSMEELGEDYVEAQPSNVRRLPDRRGSRDASRRQAASRDEHSDGRVPTNDRMTDRQRRLIYRLLAAEGYHEDDATRCVLEHVQKGRLEDVTKREASGFIDELKREDQRGA